MMPADSNQSDAAAIRRRQLVERLDRHRAHLRSLDRDAKRVPWLLLAALAAFPVGLRWGVTAAGVTVAGVIVMVGSAYYLIWGHRGEYLQKIAEVQQELRRL